MITAVIDKKNLVITLPLQTATASASGKTMVVASSHGNQPTTLTIGGKIVTIGVNAYYKD